MEQTNELHPGIHLSRGGNLNSDEPRLKANNNRTPRYKHNTKITVAIHEKLCGTNARTSRKKKCYSTFKYPALVVAHRHIHTSWSENWTCHSDRLLDVSSLRTCIFLLESILLISKKCMCQSGKKNR